MQTELKSYIHIAQEQFSKHHSVHLQFSDQPRTRTIEPRRILEAVYPMFTQRSFCILLATQLYFVD